MLAITSPTRPMTRRAFSVSGLARLHNGTSNLSEHITCAFGCEQRHVLVVVSDDPDHQDTHSGPYPVLESSERAPPHSCKSLPMIYLICNEDQTNFVCRSRLMNTVAM